MKNTFKILRVFFRLKWGELRAFFKRERFMLIVHVLGGLIAGIGICFLKEYYEIAYWIIAIIVWAIGLLSVSILFYNNWIKAKSIVNKQEIK